MGHASVGKARESIVVLVMLGMIITASPLSASASQDPQFAHRGPASPFKGISTQARIPAANRPSYYGPPARSLPAPVGVAAYGVGEDTGGNYPFVITTDQVRGYFAIGSLSAYNSSFSSPSGASLQMNVMLRVNTTKGGEDLWLQNLLDFDTSANTVSNVDNIWNTTSSSASISATHVSGSGVVVSSKGVMFYVDGTVSHGYVLPFSNSLTISALPRPGAIVVQFYYGARAFDNVTITVPHLLSSAITVTPYFRTGYGVPYDAELVWGGEYSSESTSFVHMDSRLVIYYTDQTGFRRPFPAVYTYGSDTGESADDLQTSISPVSGDGVVSVGSSRPGLLASSFLPTADGAFEAIKISFGANYLVNGTSYSGDSYFLLYQGGLRLQFFSSYPTNPGTNLTLDGLKILNVNNGSTVHLSYSSVDVKYLAGLRIVLSPSYVTEYQLSINVPLEGRVNGINKDVQNGWYLNGTTISLNTVYYQSQGQGSRLKFVPDKVAITMSGPMTISVVSVQQSFLTVTSNRPLYGLVDGRNVTLYSGWLNQTDSIKVENLTLGAGKGERFVLGSVSPSTSIALAQPVNITAVYREQFLVNISSEAPAGGTLEVPGGWYDNGTSIRLSISPNTGWAFVNWAGGGTGAYSGNESSATLVLVGPVNESALLDPKLVVDIFGYGNVGFSYESISGTFTGSSTIALPVGTSITLSPEDNSFLYEFSGWSGAINGNSASQQLTISGPTTVQATFGFDVANILLASAVVAAIAGIAVALILRRRPHVQSVRSSESTAQG